MSDPSPVVERESFRVWFRPLGSTCRIKVEGRDNAQWLLTRLTETLQLETDNFVLQDVRGTVCHFQIGCVSQGTSSDVADQLRSMPRVQLMSDPE